jgi:uncharacterized protein (DUF362 family)
MDRREFFKKTLGFAVGAGVALGLSRVRPLFAQAPAEGRPSPSKYDLVAVKNGKPDRMFDAGIKELGGMQAFVKPGQTVVVKPNIGWDAVPELAGNTNPLLVKRIVEHCFKAGAKKVIVFDNTCNYWERCYNNSGIAPAARNAGATVAPANSEGYYQSVSAPEAKYLKSAKIHEALLSADVFINVPILKQHGGSRLTISMKNLMGVVWDRGVFHSTDLLRCIADVCLYRKPDLNVVDAYNVLLRNGPRGGSTADVRNDRAQILSTDMVAADTAATKIFGLRPEQVPYLQMAADLKVGRMDLDQMSIKRISL